MQTKIRKQNGRERVCHWWPPHSVLGCGMHGHMMLWGALPGRIRSGHTLNGLNQLTMNFTFILNSTLCHMLLGGDNYGTGLNWKMSFVSPSL